MKSYTLGDWDGSLTNGTSGARDAGSEVWYDEAQATPDRQNRALNVNGRYIPMQDTRNRYPSEIGTTDAHGGAKSRMNGIQPVDASLNARRVVNGHATYNRNDGPLSAHVKSKQSPLSNIGGGRIENVQNGASNPTLSPTFVLQTPPRTGVVWPGQSLNSGITHYGLMSADAQLGMDMDDISSLSSLDAEGDEDDEDASFVDNLLMNPEPSSKTLSDDPEPSSPLSPLSPLFTPPPSTEMHINTTTSEYFSRRSSSIQQTPVDPLTSPPDVNPVASPSQVEDLRSFAIVAKGSPKQGAEATTDSRGKKRKRMVFSHIAVPPLLDSVSRQSYRSIASLPLMTSSTLTSRPAKVLAKMKVKKTLEDGFKAMEQHDLNFLLIDDCKDATYKPSAANKRKDVSLEPPKTILRETATAGERASGTASTKKSLVASPRTAIDTNIVNVHTTIPPINAETATAGEGASSTKKSSAATPTTAIDTNIINDHTTINASPLTRTWTPQPSFPISEHSPTRTQSSVRSPATGEKRKNQRRTKGGEVDSANPKPKKTKVARVDKANERKAAIDMIQHPKEQPKKHQQMEASSHSRYNPELDILRIYFHGIPTMRHSVLEVNVRHIRKEKRVSEAEDGSRYINLPHETTQGHGFSSSWFVWPPPCSDRDEEEQYYLGGTLDKFIDKEEDRLEVPGRNKVQRECCSSSYTIVGDERLPTRDKQEADLSPTLRSPITVPTHEHAKYVEDEYADQLFSRPSAKALGKRKARSPLQSGPKSPPVTPRRTDGLLMESDGENVLHMEQYLQDLGPTPQSSGGGVDGLPNLLIASTHQLSGPLHHNGYDSDTLSRALISVDNDPFIFSASRRVANNVDPFLGFNSEDAAINSWHGTSSLSGSVYKDVFNEAVAANDTIDPLLLRGPELVGSADPVDTPGIYHQQAHLIYSPPLALSTPTSHDLPRSSTMDNLSFRHPSLPLSAVGRRPLKTRRPSDMVDITHLDLGPAMELSDRELDKDYASDPVYVPNQVVQRKGPRIVSAKELARIQKRKALEREKEREKERLQNENEKASAVKAPKIGHPRSKFACGTEAAYCHQCRRRTYYLKMKCKCQKLFCNRCISMRYDNLSFNESNPEWTCPVCRNFCTCDVCTKKRGEVYVSLRVPRVTDETVEPVITRTKTMNPKKVQERRLTSSEPEYEEGYEDHNAWGGSADEAEFPASDAKDGAVIREQKPFPPTLIVGDPGSHWGYVYSLSGEKFGTACVGEGNKSVKVTCTLPALPTLPTLPTLPAVVVASAVPPLRKRVFVGRMQSSWGKDMVKNSKIRVLEDEDIGEPKRLSRQENTNKQRRVVFRKRFYIGDPEVLLKRVVRKRRKEDGGSTGGTTSETGQTERARFAYSLSPLSSLSSLPSDSEGEGGGTKDKAGTTLDDGSNLGLESQFDKVEVKAAQAKTKKQEASQDKGAGANSSLGKQDGVPQPENKAVKDGYKVEMKERTKAEADGKGERQKGKERGSSASFSPDSLGDNDVARAILLSFSACSMPVNA